MPAGLRRFRVLARHRRIGRPRARPLRPGARTARNRRPFADTARLHHDLRRPAEHHVDGVDRQVRPCPSFTHTHADRRPAGSTRSRGADFGAAGASRVARPRIERGAPGRRRRSDRFGKGDPDGRPARRRRPQPLAEPLVAAALASVRSPGNKPRGRGEPSVGRRRQLQLRRHPPGPAGRRARRLAMATSGNACCSRPAVDGARERARHPSALAPGALCPLDPGPVGLHSAPPPSQDAAPARRRQSAKDPDLPEHCRHEPRAGSVRRAHEFDQRASERRIRRSTERRGDCHDPGRSTATGC